MSSKGHPLNERHIYRQLSDNVSIPFTEARMSFSFDGKNSSKCFKVLRKRINGTSCAHSGVGVGLSVLL